MRLISTSSLLIGLTLLSAPLHAQAPEQMSYQAVVRDANDVLVTNQSALRINGAPFASSDDRARAPSPVWLVFKKWRRV